MPGRKWLKICLDNNPGMVLYGVVEGNHAPTNQQNQKDINAMRTINSFASLNSRRLPTPLDREQLRTLAPSIFADAPHSRTSARYSFLPTASVLDGLQAEGWIPVRVQEQRVRDESREGFQKHIIRFAHRDHLDLAKVGDLRPELVLLNSHDRSSGYQLHAGLFRLACLNGLVVSDSALNRIGISHVGFEPGKVIEASVEIVKEIPRLLDSVKALRATSLEAHERLAFAEAATLLRYDSIETAPVRPQTLLETRRSQDASPDIFTTLNVVQENVIQGGQRDYGKVNRDEFGRVIRSKKTRAVNSIDGNVALNKALWHLAEALKAAKQN